MSQEQPKQPKKETQQRPVARPKTTPSNTQLQNKNSIQSVLKAQTAKALRGTIQWLESVVETLEAEPTQPPSKVAIAPPPSVTVSLQEEPSSREILTTSTPVETPPPALETEENVTPLVEERIIPAEPASVVPQPETPVEIPAQKPVETPATQQSAPPTLVDKFLPSFDRFQGWWTGTLQTIRRLLPASLNEKLSDWTLTGAIASFIVVLLLTTVALLPGKPAEVATVPSVPPPELNTPPELKAPKQPEPVELAPLPPPVLTPEQNLIASIQNQVAEITNQYADGLIQSLEANFPASHLIVKVGEDWYNLRPAKQDKLADEMLRRSQELDFSKLELIDPAGTLVARTPVVGSHMVILKRQNG